MFFLHLGCDFFHSNTTTTLYPYAQERFDHTLLIWPQGCCGVGWCVSGVFGDDTLLLVHECYGVAALQNSAMYVCGLAKASGSICYFEQQSPPPRRLHSGRSSWRYIGVLPHGSTLVYSLLGVCALMGHAAIPDLPSSAMWTAVRKHVPPLCTVLTLPTDIFSYVQRICISVVWPFGGDRCGRIP